MNKQIKKSKKKFSFGSLILFIFMAAACLFWADAAFKHPTEIAGAAETAADIADTARGGPPDIKIPTVLVGPDEIADTRFLELINGEFAYRGAARSIVCAWPTVPVSAADVSLHEAALDSVAKLFAAARDAQAGTFYISSGYRDRAEQKQIYDASQDRSFAQPPGHSEHESGLAADIMAVGVSASVLGASPEGRWLAENAWKFGLILRYPDGKQNITGISYEPWHFRYIGEPHAAYCNENDLCLEEYISFLREAGEIEIGSGGETYLVIYERAADGAIRTPETMEHEVSGDNAGGYIITALVK